MDYLVFYIALAAWMSVVSLPLYLYGTATLYRDWNKAFFVKRHRVLIVVSIINLIGIQFVYLIPTCTEYLLNRTTETTYFYTIVTVLVPNTYSYFALNCIRAWLLYYDINITKFQKHKAWLSAIDPETENKNWFKNKESTYGNSIFLFKYTAILIILFALICTVFHLLLMQLMVRILTWIVITTLTVTTGVIWRKLKHYYYDNLGIRKEMLYTMRNGLFWLSFGIFTVVFVQIGMISFELYYVLFTFMVSCFANCLMFLLTVYPKITNTPTAKINKCIQGCVINSLCCNCNQGNQTSDEEEDMSIYKYNNWQFIVCTNYGFESLMNHLEKEFSIENLLFVSEVCLYVYVRMPVRMHWLSNLYCSYPLKSKVVESRINVQKQKGVATVQLPLKSVKI